jgi:hypothetical protein
MESSRGGPLTTFIMMLPLIVVPALAMFRPSGPEGSLLSSLLSAGSNDSSVADAPDDGADIDGFSESDFEAEFAEILDSSSSTTGDEDSIFTEDPSFPSDSGADETPSVATPQTFPRSAPAPDLPADADLETLTTQLRMLGATRTLWFSPGDNSTFGFVAFFPAGQGSVRYRFEAIAASRVAAVQAVTHQAREWKSSQAP